MESTPYLYDTLLSVLSQHAKCSVAERLTQGLKPKRLTAPQTCYPCGPRR